jgi:hypothetical protein
MSQPELTHVLRLALLFTRLSNVHCRCIDPEEAGEGISQKDGSACCYDDYQDDHLGLEAHLVGGWSIFGSSVVEQEAGNVVKKDRWCSVQVVEEEA